MIKGKKLLFFFASDLLQKPLLSLSSLFIVVLSISLFSPLNYNFSVLKEQERIQFKRKNGGAISVQTGMDNQRAIRFNCSTHAGLLICLKGAAKPEEKGKKRPLGRCSFQQALLPAPRSILNVHSPFYIYTQFKQWSGSKRGKCFGRNAWLTKLNKEVARSSIILYFIYTKPAIPLSFSETICKESKTGQRDGNNWL